MCSALWRFVRCAVAASIGCSCVSAGNGTATAVTLVIAVAVSSNVSLLSQFSVASCH
jgi:hypothetical protein